jgi:hypothetical protein
MKKTLLCSAILFAGMLSVNAQGLENIIVEKYYISNANDASVNSVGGVLPVGSVTYRVYVDMLPDYVVQSIYGDPNHELRIETSTLFFNNEDRGAVHPTMGFNFLDDNTVMLDSWLSVGAACNGRFGVLKTADDGVGTIVNTDGVLQNNDPLMGIPLTQQDGILLAATAPEPVITVGIGNDITVFDAQNDGTNGPLFSTFNGAWASVNGSAGPDPATNQVLIAQITTDGTFSFNLNIQIRNQTTFAVENYVASAATGNEIEFPALNYNSDSTTSIVQVVTETPAFSVYPNPAIEVISLVTSMHGKTYQGNYKVFDILGNMVLNGSTGLVSGTNKHQVQISNLNSGIYFIEMDFNGAKTSRKFIKQ